MAEAQQKAAVTACGEFRGRIYDSITETIGATPLVRLNRLAAEHGVKADIVGKCEFFNPLASVKDRIGAGHDRGGGSGGRDPARDDGAGRADLGQYRHRARFRRRPRGLSADPHHAGSMSIERRKMLALLGAELELTPAAQGMKRRHRDGPRSWSHDARRRHAAAVRQSRQSRDPPPHHRGGNLERHRRQGRRRRLRRRHRRHADRRRPGAEAAQARAAHGRGRARGQPGALGRPARPAQDPGHRRRLHSGDSRHQADRRDDPHRQRDLVQHGARSWRASRACRSAFPRAPPSPPRSRSARARRWRESSSSQCCRASPSAISRRRFSTACEAA